MRHGVSGPHLVAATSATRFQTVTSVTFHEKDPKDMAKTTKVSTTAQSLLRLTRTTRSRQVPPACLPLGLRTDPVNRSVVHPLLGSPLLLLPRRNLLQFNNRLYPALALLLGCRVSRPSYTIIRRLLRRIDLRNYRSDFFDLLAE